MLEPTGHHVLIKPDEVEEVTETGIVVITDEQSKRRELAATTTGEIVAVGRNAWKAFDDGEPWAHVGDRVYFTKHVSKVIEDNNTEYFLMTDDNVLCIIREE